MTLKQFLKDLFCWHKIEIYRRYEEKGWIVRKYRCSKCGAKTGTNRQRIHTN